MNTTKYDVQLQMGGLVGKTKSVQKWAHKCQRLKHIRNGQSQGPFWAKKAVL